MFISDELGDLPLHHGEKMQTSEAVTRSHHRPLKVRAGDRPSHGRAIGAEAVRAGLRRHSEVQSEWPNLR